MLGVCLKYTQNNYGSKLQALATVKLFEDFGIDYEIIRYNKKTFRFLIKSIPRCFNWVFLNDRYLQIQRAVEFKRHPEIKKQVDIRNEAFNSFDVHFQNHFLNSHIDINILLMLFYQHFRGLLCKLLLIFYHPV